MRAKESDHELRARIGERAYEVTQLGGTEPPFSGQLNHHQEFGSYHCVVCNEKLFDSTSKFESHCGWPSFDWPAAMEVIDEVLDMSHGMRRQEVRCHNCTAHLGHVFNDGPTTTGRRYCINSVALVFKSHSA